MSLIVDFPFELVALVSGLPFVSESERTLGSGSLSLSRDPRVNAQVLHPSRMRVCVQTSFQRQVGTMAKVHSGSEPPLSLMWISHIVMPDSATAVWRSALNMHMEAM